MRVLIACEESGKVRDAFRSLGHDAWSCDLIPARDGSPFHIQRDAVDVASQCGPWDLMIAFPPCTHLASSGARWFAEKRADGRQTSALAFAMRLWALPIPRIAIENPIGILSRPAYLGKASQIIQPWQFGHGETKATCLWLKGLPLLRPSRIVRGRDARVWKMGPGPNRQRDRSETYTGIARAMAAQWGQK